MKLAISLLLATAVWTGASYQTKTYDGKPAVQCQYRVQGNGYTFWRTFAGFNCPASVQVN